jgi:polysaccharide biosynthesis/export protein
MNDSVTQTPRSSISGTQQGTRLILRFLRLFFLLWGFNTASVMFWVVVQPSKALANEAVSSFQRQVRDPHPKVLQESSDRSGSNLETIELNTYRLGPGDTISASITPRGKDLNFSAVVDRFGNVAVPLVGVLSLKDLTLKQAEEAIRIKLAEFLVNPQVGLVLTSARPVRVLITGEVERPGFYSLQDARLPNALIEAGGTTRLADLRTIQVRRQSGYQAPQELRFDLYTPLLTGIEPSDLRLVDGDIILISALPLNGKNNYDRNLVAGANIAQKEITIRVLDYSSGVNRLSLPNGGDFLDALTSIKPSLKDTNLSKVSLIRFDQSKGRAVAINVNARNALKGDPSQNPTLENNDVIVINRNLISRINNALNQVTQPFKDVLGFLLFFDTASNGINQVFGSNND